MGHPSRNGVLSALLAIVGPLMLIAMALAELNKEPPWSPEPAIQYMDKALERRQPDVVVIGPSMARSDIDEEALGAALGDPPLKSLRIARVSAPAAEWYAMLKYRLLPQEHRPRLLVVVATMPLAWEGPLSSERAAQVSAHFAQPDEVLVDKAFGGERDPRLRRIFTRRTVVWKEMLDAFRGALVASVFPDTNPPMGGLERAERAAAGVFRKETTTGMEVASRVIPVVEEQPEGDKAKDALAGKVEETFLPDLVALAGQNGIRLAFVLPPVLATRIHDVRIDDARERETLDWARRNEIAWIDLRDRVFSTLDYVDGRHMTRSAAVSFSRLVGERIVASGILGNGPLLRPRSRARVERTGTPDAIVVPSGTIRHIGDCGLRFEVPVLRGLSDDDLFVTAPGAVSPLEIVFRGSPLPRVSVGTGFDKVCRGNFVQNQKAVFVSLPESGAETPVLRWNPAAPLENRGVATWWIYPGSGLSWGWDAPWSEPDTEKRLFVSLLGFGPADVAPVLISEGARMAVPLVPSENAEPVETPVLRFEGELELPAAQGPFSVDISSPPGGPVLLLRGLVVRTAEGSEAIVEPRAARSDSLFRDDVTFAGPPPEPEPSQLTKGKRQWFFPVTAGSRIGCCPYVVLEDGTAQTAPDMGACSKNAFGSPFPELPVEVPKAAATMVDSSRYRLAYRPDRRCLSRRWLLPGDSLRTTVATTWPMLLGPVRKVTILGRVDGDPSSKGTITVHLQHGDFTVDERLDLPAVLKGRSWTVPPTGKATLREPWEAEIRGTPDLPPILLEATISDG